MEIDGEWNNGIMFFCLVFGVLKFLHSSPPDEIFLDFTGQASSNPQKHCTPPCSFTPLRYVKLQGDVATRNFPVGDYALAATGGSVLKFGSPSLKLRRLKSLECQIYLTKGVVW